MPSQDTIASLQKQFPGKVGQGKEFRDEWQVEIDRDLIRPASAYMKELGFNMLLDITSVDYFGDEPRYEVIYEFVALGGVRDQEHLRLKVKVSEDDPSIDSIITVYQGADWHEREIFDMMGITFTGHPDLRRILMWEGYPHHPLKKDFPLEGPLTDLPGEEGFSRVAPLEGGPFVAAPSVHPPKVGEAGTTLREPHAHPPATEFFDRINKIYRIMNSTPGQPDPLTKKVIGEAMHVHCILGSGFVESIYHNALLIRLKKLGLRVESQKPLPVHFEGEIVGEFFADVIVEGRLILELKAVSSLVSAHEVQLVNYLTRDQDRNRTPFKFRSHQFRIQKKKPNPLPSPLTRDSGANCPLSCKSC